MKEVYAVTAKTKDNKIFIELVETEDDANNVIDEICSKSNNDITKDRFNIEKLVIGHQYVLNQYVIGGK